MGKTILYLHGMGGGGDSRIPRLLREWFAETDPDISVVCRTYSFDPEEAHPLILSWVEELHPYLVIGESLGSIHALRLPAGIPKLLVSPALGGPSRLCRIAYLTLIPGVPWICTHLIWRVKPGDRQTLRFRWRTLRKYRAHFEAMLAAARRLEATEAAGRIMPIHAFIGTRDHYLRSGVVDVALWERLFGADTLTRYDGTHFMEEEYVRSRLIPAIQRITAGL